MASRSRQQWSQFLDNGAKQTELTLTRRLITICSQLLCFDALPSAGTNPSSFRLATGRPNVHRIPTESVEFRDNEHVAILESVEKPSDPLPMIGCDSHARGQYRPIRLNRSVIYGRPESMLFG
jgi:hypothetical protein